MSGSQEILEAALKLEPAKRAALAQELLASLDANDAISLGPAQVDPDFARELERRIREVESGEVKSVPWSEVKARLESRLRGR